MRVNNATPPTAGGLLVLALSFIGALTVLEWVWRNTPRSIEAAASGFQSWLTAPVVSPLDLIGFGFMVLIVFVVLVYPMVIRP